MNFKCVDNALQRVDNGSQRICNVIPSIVKTLTMLNKCLRMDEKCFSTRWQLFLTFDPNAAQNVENKERSAPRCNKAKHIVNTTSSALFTINKFNFKNIKILHLRELDFV